MYEKTVRVEITILGDRPGYVLAHDETIFCGDEGISPAEYKELAENLRKDAIELLGFEPWRIRVWDDNFSREFYESKDEEEILKTNAASIQTGDVISLGGNKRYKVSGCYISDVVNIVTIVVNNDDIYTVPKEMPVTIYR